MGSIPQIFKYEDHQLRTMTIEGEPWLVASDVCDILEISRVDSAIRCLDDDEKGTQSVRTLGGLQKVIFTDNDLRKFVSQHPDVIVEE